MFNNVKIDQIIRAMKRFMFWRNQNRWLPEITSRNKNYSAHDIGEWTYGYPKILTWTGGSKLTIGKFCSIAENVTILLGGEHRIDWVTTYPFSDIFVEANSFSGHPTTKGDVVIGNDVWIGRDSLILSGVKIGDGAVVGAHSVVAKDVMPYSIVAGNPAHHIRYRFDQEKILILQKIAWWDWPLNRVKEAFPLLLSNDIDRFINVYKNSSSKS